MGASEISNRVLAECLAYCGGSDVDTELLRSVGCVSFTRADVGRYILTVDKDLEALTGIQATLNNLPADSLSPHFVEAEQGPAANQVTVLLWGFSADPLNLNPAQFAKIHITLHQFPT